MPPSTVASFAGTGNPFSMGELRPGETVLDLGCGAGFDTLQAAPQVAPEGRVIAVDMTEAMLGKTRAAAEQLELPNVETRLGYAEELPVDDASVDVVISNGVINLTPDLRLAIQDIFASGDRVAVRVTLSGTHRGPLFGRPGTGRPFVMNQVNIYRFEERQLAETWQLGDVAGFLSQIGG